MKFLNIAYSTTGSWPVVFKENQSSPVLQIQIMTKSYLPSGYGALPYAMPVPQPVDTIMYPVIGYDALEDCMITITNQDELNDFLKLEDNG